MSLNINLSKSYQLRTKDNNSKILLLPTIELRPDLSNPNNLPHISSLTVSVSGTPEYLAEKIQSVYKDYKYRKPSKLSQHSRLKQPDCYLTKPLPADFNGTLSVSIDYFDSDESGDANLSVPKNVKAQCNLSSSNEPQQASPPTPKPVSPQKPIQLKDLGDQSHSSPPPEKRIAYPGWFAIDFGTSNSTVTLYDPKQVNPPKNLPKEQESCLRQLLADWINKRPMDESLKMSNTDWNTEWEKLLSEVIKHFKDIKPEERETLGEQIFLGTKSTYLLEAIRLIEISLNYRAEWFRRAAWIQLNQIYYHVSRVPPLDWQSLIPVELDLVRKEEEIPSELEIESLDPSLPDDNPSKVKVLMGNRAIQDRENTLANSQEINSVSKKFHHSPKRYFGKLDKQIPVELNGTNAKIPAENLIQSAYAHLIQLTEDYRKSRPQRFAKGDFEKGVITYPTIAPPEVRRKIEQLVKKLGIQNVQIAYDEAVAVAIFYLLREFGGDLNIGIESFKTRCCYYEGKWSQNVLILDIGGGTTDIAVIRLTLEEINPFDPYEDRGKGGRYYKLTPKLLGSSGHLKLGGELITLRIFKLLKAAIADSLLTAVQKGDLEENLLNIRLNEINERFLINGEFQSGTLLACVDKDNPESDSVAYQDALNDAEKVVSTSFGKEHPELLLNFVILWEYAEQAKLELGKKRDSNHKTEPTFVLNGEQISKLLDQQNETSSSSQSLENLSVTITIKQFEKVVEPVITEAIGIAKGLMMNRLDPEKEQLDWLILSGQTCNLYLVEQELYKQFSKSEYFLPNTERITFVPQYSKLATSIGACYAEKLRQLTFDRQDAKPVLRKGANQLYFDIKNLLYFLPCSFYREAIGVGYEIFQAGQKLSLLDPQYPLVKLRSDWQGAQLNNTIQRQDFEGMTPQLWGNYNAETLMKQLNIITEEDFREEIKVQFEIDQNLEFTLLFCNGNPPHRIKSDITTLDAGEKMGKTPVIVDNHVICDIAVCVAESATALSTDAHTLLFKANEDYSEKKKIKIFYHEDETPQLGLIETLPEFPRNGKHTFYFQFRDPDTNSWELIGELPKPQINTELPCKYQASLDEKGILRIHLGEVPYRTSDSTEDLKQEGYVVRIPLEPQYSEGDEKRDPFSGIH